jgi:hypothetical protein
MSLVEKALADDIVELRHQESLGTGYVPIADAIAAKCHHLEREQHWRGVMHEMTDDDGPRAA